jgi:hypothetical protein
MHSFEFRGFSFLFLPIVYGFARIYFLFTNDILALQGRGRSGPAIPYVKPLGNWSLLYSCFDNGTVRTVSRYITAELKMPTRTVCTELSVR